MGPPSFISCFVCQRGFGSQSIHIHVPSCLEKWHQENNKKRKPERSKPPSPPPMYPVSVQLRPGNHRPLSGGGKRARPITARLDKPKVLNATLSKEVDMSKLTREMVRKMPNPIVNSDIQKANMTNTTTPTVTTPGSGATTTSSDYSSGDFTSSSSSPLGGDHKQSGEEEEEDGGILSASGGESESESTANKKPARPGTMKLPRPSRHIGVPIIIPTAAKAPPRRGTITIIKSYPPKQRRKNLEEVFTGPREKLEMRGMEAAPLKDKPKIPQPCLTCGKEQNPERFHSHPTHMTKFKAKEKTGNKDPRSRKATNSTNKRIVTKPLPLMYKSGGKTVLGKVDSGKKNLTHDDPQNNNTVNNRRNKSLSVDNLVGMDGRDRRRRQPPLKSRSADNSPSRAKTKATKSRRKDNLEPTSEPEDASSDAPKSLPLSHYIKQSKASMSGKESGEGGIGDAKQDFSIDFFEKESKNAIESAEASPFHNPFRDKHLGNPLAVGRKKGSRNNSNTSSPSKFGGMTNSVRGGPLSRQNSQGRGRGNSRQANMVRRPSMLDERPVEEPSDDEELEDIVIMKPLTKVLDNFKTEDSFKDVGAPPRRMRAIEEESSGKGGSRPGTSQRSALLTCYICGREFGTRSLPIHEPHCLEKWERDNALLPRELQRPVPQRPDHNLTREEWNEFAWTASQAQLVPCWCGRTFFPERLAVHQKGCKPPPGKGRPGSTTSQYELPPNATLGSAKRTVSCYICGREFGSRSIAIHEPQCRNKWRKENSELPLELQRREPRKPEIIYDEEGRVDRVAMEQAAWQSHLETLVKCTNCSRTFLPDSLIKHQRSCRGEVA